MKMKFSIMPSRAVSDKNLQPNVVRTLSALCCYTSANQICYPNQNTLGELIGVSRALITRNISIKDINWLGNNDFLDAPSSGWNIEVKVRSTHSPIPALIIPQTKTTANIVLGCDEQGISPGQASVFYDPESTRVLGGGWITND